MSEYTSIERQVREANGLLTRDEFYNWYCGYNYCREPHTGNLRRSGRTTEILVQAATRAIQMARDGKCPTICVVTTLRSYGALLSHQLADFIDNVGEGVPARFRYITPAEITALEEANNNSTVFAIDHTTRQGEVP